MKLLAKTAEERYQTAAGVEADLRRCLGEWGTGGGISRFPLGVHDASDRLLISERLYGREAEIADLLAAFDRVVAGGKTELVLVSGFSGIGKSSVVMNCTRRWSHRTACSLRASSTSTSAMYPTLPWHWPFRALSARFWARAMPR